VNNARALFTKVNNVEGCCMVQQQEAPRTCFHILAFQMWNWMGSMNSILYFFLVIKRCYICVLNKTQTQQRRQTLSKSDMLCFRAQWISIDLLINSFIYQIKPFFFFFLIDQYHSLYDNYDCDWLIFNKHVFRYFIF